MNTRVLFMIVGNEVKYLSGSNMDHREWYTSLGMDPNNFDNIVRGYILDNKIIYFKGMMFNYDEEVISKARIFTPSIRIAMNNPSLEVYCGIVVNGQGQKWEPVLRINENEITGFVQTKPVDNRKEKEHIETGPVIEFKNNYEDPKFIKVATIVTGIVLVLVIIIKIMLFGKREILQLSNFFDVILSLAQILALVFVIYGYNKKIIYTKYIGIIASILIILTLDIFDIIIGILYFIFSVDQNYFVKCIGFIKNLINKKN